MSAAEKRFIADALFRQRALAEAARYGSDPWVFVRELLQNSRDAGARHVELRVSEEDGEQRVSCRDDGCGMSFAHARQYLFSLYASSKEDQREEAGKFGIGFWSVLRFAPSSIVIRSRAGSEPAWQVTLEGDLEWATVADAELAEGTEIVLERPAEGHDLADGGVGLAEQLAEQVYVAACRYGRFLTRLDQPGKPLRVTVDGRRVNSEFKLPAPCAKFSGRGFRGAVGLGSEPRVELFAHGLFVRSADSLQDLRELGEPGRGAGAEDALAELPSLAPQVLLDGAELDLLLARGDARQDKALRRVLRAAEMALDRLVSRQLQALRPQPWYRSWPGALRDRLEPWLDGARERLNVPRAAAVVLAAVAMIATGAVLASLWSDPPPASPSASAAAAAAPRAGLPIDAGGRDAAGRVRSGGPASAAGELGTGSAGAAVAAHPGAPASGFGTTLPARNRPTVRSYSDLARRYHGPRPGRLDAGSSAVALAYRPASQTVLFNALVIDELGANRWGARPLGPDPPAYRGVECRRGCVEVVLRLDSDGPVRIPMPTGHRLDPSSLTLAGEPVPAFETVDGEAVLILPGKVRGLLEYRTGPAAVPERRAAAAAGNRDFPVPRRLAGAAERLRGLPVPERVAQGMLFVAEHVVYDRSPEAARAYLDGGRPFAETALEIGAGDCDVQNGLLVELLREAGVEARLALGYVGFGGTALPGLHAWAEYLDDGRWRVADVSTESADAGAGRGRRPIDAAARLPVEVLAGIVPASPARWRPWTAGVLLLLAAGGAGWAAARRRSADGGVELDPSGDLAALLGGALRHPGAFSSLPAMAHGRFVPLLARAEAISIDRARRLAARRRLFRSSIASRLARDAVAHGTPVVDAGTPEGRVLSLALGAIDLDHWSRLLERSSESGLARWVNLQLETLGEPWRVRAVPGLGEPMTELALEDLGLGRRLILLDPEHPELAPARRFLPDRPETAAFTAVDLVVHRLDLTDRDRSRILSACARRALAEARG